MKVPSYLQRAVEPWTGTAAPVDFDQELEKLRDVSAPLLARGASTFERGGGAPCVVGAPSASAATAYDRSGGHAAYAVRAGAGLPPDGPELPHLEDELLDPGELSPEEEEARLAALAEHEPEEKSDVNFLERAAWRAYKANRARSRVEDARFRFGEREELVVARRFDDMYRRNEEDYEFELLMRDK